MKKSVEKKFKNKGNKWILVLNIISKLFCYVGIIAFCAFVFGMGYGITKLYKADSNYNELILSDDFQVALYPLVMDGNDFLDKFDEAKTQSDFIFVYSVKSLENIVGLLLLLSVYFCSWLITDEIRKNEMNVFSRDNLKNLVNCSYLLIFLFFVECLLAIVTKSEVLSYVTYIVVICVFRYLFEVGCKLKEEKFK